MLSGSAMVDFSFSTQGHVTQAKSIGKKTVCLFSKRLFQPRTSNLQPVGNILFGLICPTIGTES